MLLETGKVSLAKIMQGLQSSYTQLYNRRHRTVGHLFQGRYKAILCDKNQYLLELVRYIHLNPARMRRALDPWKYRWSSHQGYVGGKTAVVVQTAMVLGQLGKRIGEARRAYLRYMEEGMETGHEEKYYQTADQRFLGGEQFIEEIASRAKDKEVQPGGPRVSFERLAAAIAKEYGIDREALVGTGRRKELVQARRQLVWLARQWAKMTTRELGERFKRDASMISRLSREYEENRDARGESSLARALSSKKDRIQNQA